MKTFNQAADDDIASVMKRVLRSADYSALSAAIVESPASTPDKAAIAAKEKYCIALGGCQYPAGLLDSKPAYAAYERLARRILEDKEVYQALILTGDQIYIDVTAGLFDPTQLDDSYRRSYERWLHKLPVRLVTARIPLLPMLDDHEIHDNWEPVSDFYPELKAAERERLKLGIREYCKYQRSSGPFNNPAQNIVEGQPLWCNLDYAGLPVFLADTRTERQHRTVENIDRARIMSSQQMNALKEWLRETDNDLPKLIITSSILLPRHSRVASLHQAANNSDETPITNALLSDSWDGYPASLHELLSFIVEEQIENIVFVSGDEHIACATRAELQGITQVTSPVVIHSIHTSALYAPYPFANAMPQDLVQNEDFIFSSRTKTGSTKTYTCKVNSEFYSSQGFSLLNLTLEQGYWSMFCEFDRGMQQNNPVYSCRL